jgi:phosphomannomutase/phosphoglucomutase
VRLLKILAADADNRTPSQVFAALPSSVATPEIRVDVSEGEQHRLAKKFVDLAQFESARSNNIDGLRVDFPDGWGLLRASNTQPSLVLRFEADSESSLQRIQALFRAQLAKIKPDLELPF